MKSVIRNSSNLHVAKSKNHKLFLILKAETKDRLPIHNL